MPRHIKPGDIVRNMLKATAKSAESRGYPTTAAFIEAAVLILEFEQEVGDLPRRTLAKFMAGEINKFVSDTREGLDQLRRDI